MHEFKYKKKRFYCENVNIANVASKIQTPFYLYSRKTLLDHYGKLKTAFRKFKPLICFSVKANSNLALLKILLKAGAGLDVVSGGELYKALRAGADPKKIVYASVGKTGAEIREAIVTGILFFNVESLPELILINKVAGKLNKKVRVAIRLNPDVIAGTHSYITTSKKENKFGLDFKTAGKILEKRDDFPNLSIEGLHVHIGSQITEARPYQQALSKIVRFITALKKANIKINYLNIGGGLGIVYREEKPQTAASFAKNISFFLKQTNAKIILEPGRFIAGNSGVLVTKVLYVKETPSKNFVIIDAGMNDLVRPSLYSAYHNIVPQQKAKSKFSRPIDIVGPICESGDFMAKGRSFPRVKEGDLLVILGAGAYGFSMSSNYNSRPRVAEVLVRGNKFCLIRRRETYADLVSKEIF